MSPHGLSDDEFDRWRRQAGKAQLAEILYWVWDPIGVNGAFPVTRGEYDTYITPVLMELKHGGQAAEIDALLIGFETDQMGLRPRGSSADEPSRAAKLIETWFEQSIGYWRAHPGDNWRHA